MPGRKQSLLDWLRLVLASPVPTSIVGRLTIYIMLRIAEFFAAWLVSAPCTGVRPSLRSRPGMPIIKAQRTWTIAPLADRGSQPEAGSKT